MVTVALVNPPLSKMGYRHQLYPPIGLPYLAAVLEKDGHDIKVIDCEALSFDHKILREKLASLEPDVVGITSTTPTIQSGLLSAQFAKEACSNATVVLGGPHATFVDEQILNEEKAVDIIVRGEGEQTLSELIEKLSRSHLEDLDQVAGITFRRNGRIVRTPDRPFIQDLDQLPRPAWEHFPLDEYRVSGRLILPVITSRGCPFQCSFCVSTQMFGKKFRTRRIENVVDEIEWLRDTHGADAFSFYDDIFTFDMERAGEICEEIERRDVGLPWNFQTRVDRVSRRLLTKMGEADCELVYFGVESGCQEILDAVSKDTSIQQNENAIRWAKEAGLVVIVSLMIGYPGETEETLKQTFNLIRRLKPDDAYLCVATPYPGTGFYRSIKKRGWELSPDWSLYDTTNPVFKNPSISKEKILEMRKKFVDDFYSPFYILRHMLKDNFYHRLLARIGINHLIWRIRSSLKVDTPLK